MQFYQKEIKLNAFSRGFHLITDELLNYLPQIQNIKVGQFQVFIKHTSASLILNENADFTVRQDFERHFNVLVPENQTYYKHTYEGSDDMPAHIKNAILGASVQIPITNGSLNLGVWQGIYLCEHRNNASCRTVVITAFGV